jgi:hypothetical protein
MSRDGRSDRRLITGHTGDEDGASDIIGIQFLNPAIG